MAKPFARRESAQMAAVWGNRLSEREVRHTRVEDESSIENYYDIGPKLGQGSFGIVCEATQMGSGAKWAIKAINKEKAGSSAVQLLEREVAILKLVEHPHIIHLEEVFETAKKMYLVMEICEKGEVADMIKDGKIFSEEETKSIMQQLGSAVSYLHKHDIVHRDLKLENILIKETSTTDDSHRYQIRVTDFGLSVVKGAPGIDNMMEDFCGTPIYMAPEIVDGKSYSHLCDCWAMGVIMYTLICGHAPFRSKDETELYEQIKRAHASFSSAVWSKVSDQGKNVIRKFLNADPAHRLSATELVNHAWITGVSTGHSGNVLEMMKEFQKECRVENGEEKVTQESPANGEEQPESSAVNGKTSKGTTAKASSSTGVKKTSPPSKGLAPRYTAGRSGLSPSLRPPGKPTSPKAPTPTVKAPTRTGATAGKTTKRQK